MDRRREERKTADDKFYNRNTEYNKQKKQRQDKRKARDAEYKQSQETANLLVYKGMEDINNAVFSTFLSVAGHYNGKDVDIVTFKKLLLLHPRTSLKRVLKKYKTTIITFHPDKFSGPNQHIALSLTQVLNRGKTEIEQLYATNTTSV
jgi:hypothetical protein